LSAHQSSEGRSQGAFWLPIEHGVNGLEIEQYVREAAKPRDQAVITPWAFVAYTKNWSEELLEFSVNPK